MFFLALTPLACQLVADEAVVIAGRCSPLNPLAKSNLFTDFTFLDLVVLQVQLHVHMEMGMKGSGW